MNGADVMQGLVAAIITLGALAMGANAQVSAWKPVPGHIMTKWAADVSPDKVWPEYPRPQMVRGEWLSLNGLWDYNLSGLKSEHEGKILVPFPIESALSGVAKPLGPIQLLTYKRSFTIPAEWKGRRLLLHFGAADWKAVVRVNGKYIGQHTGGYDPFTFDVTHAATPGTNEIIVEVNDPTDSAGQPIGKQRLTPEGIWYTATSGLWQTVWIEPVPAEGIQSLRASADPNTGIVRLTVTGLNDSLKLPWEAAITLEGKDVGTIRGTLGQEASVAVTSPQAWSPDRPTLYDLRIRVLGGAAGAHALDIVKSYFAFRTVKVAKDEAGQNRIMLNSKPIFQFGPLDQGFWPDGLYTPPTDEAMKQDILAVKRMGGNMLRKHVKVEPDRFYYWCDKLGVLVWQDMPSPFPAKNTPPDWKKAYEDELSRMIAALRNHPSIIMWVPFNEGWGQHETQDIVAKIAKWDPSRLINNASGWTDMHVGSVSDLHAYPGPAMPAAESARACVLGEFGGLGLPLDGHTWVSKNNWGYVSFKDQRELTDAYVALIDRIPALIAQGLCAAVYTQTTDVEIECNGWMTYDRAVWKIDPERAAPATRRLFDPPPKITIVVPTAQQSQQTWRYTLEQPAEGWIGPSFDDAAWKSGSSGFGTDGTPGAVIGTPWSTGDIWLRRNFELTATDLQSPHLSVHHDEDAEVFINGTQVAQLKGYTTGYTLDPLDAKGRGALRKGVNTLAVHCHQTKGGQFIDVGIVDLTPK
jgi:hypothetical protein